MLEYPRLTTLIVSCLMVAAAYASPVFLQDPPKKCPAADPAYSQDCPSQPTGGSCSNRGIVSITCSTKDPGECEPAEPDFPCRWSCTLKLRGQGGEYVCVNGAGYNYNQCASASVQVPTTYPYEVSFSRTKEVACNDDGDWRISWYTSDGAGNFTWVCCWRVQLFCDSCN